MQTLNVFGILLKQPLRERQQFVLFVIVCETASSLLMHDFFCLSQKQKEKKAARKQKKTQPDFNSLFSGYHSWII